MYMIVSPHTLLAPVLALPHVLYALVWFWPDVWRRQPFDGVKALVACGVAGKALQFASCLLWIRAVCQDKSCSSSRGLEHMASWEGLGTAVLVCGGQLLNLSTYRALGTVGVYYGHKLGRRVPWVTTFPFNVTSHPQYVGSVATIWGAACCLHRVFPPDADTQSALLWVTLFWIALYWASAWMECM